MASGNKLELVVEVDVNKANASIASIGTGLSSMEQAAGKAARGAPAGIDSLTVSMVNGLRTMGIFVDLNREVDRQEMLAGRALYENEVRQLRYNAVMRESAKIQDAAAAATGSAEERDRLEKRLPEQVDNLEESRAVDGLGWLFGRYEFISPEQVRGCDMKAIHGIEPGFRTFLPRQLHDGA